MHRVRSHTNGNHNHPNNHRNNHPNSIYMSTTQNISAPSHQSNNNHPNSIYMSNTQNISAPMSSHGNLPLGNQYHKQSKISPINNMNTAATHNLTGTMYHTYHNKQDCVWSIKLFQQPEVANNFACQTCCEIPKTDFAYICDKELIYCEYCIDIKYRRLSNQYNHKKRLPIMVQNMINELKCKCCHYSSCKWRGNIRNLSQHLQICRPMFNNNNNNKSNSNYWKDVKKIAKSKVETTDITRFTSYLQWALQQHYNSSLNEKDFQWIKKPQNQKKTKTVKSYRKHAKKLNDNDNNISNKIHSNQQPRYIVFCLGGVSYSEIKTCYQFSNNNDIDIFVGSTLIYSPQQYLKCFDKAKKDDQ
eukprot:23342_1